jgi:hypothetical protein
MKHLIAGIMLAISRAIKVKMATPVKMVLQVLNGIQVLMFG